MANKLARLRAELLEERQAVSAAELAREANTRGLKTTRGGDWSRQSVSRALRRFAEKERHDEPEEAPRPAG